MTPYDVIYVWSVFHSTYVDDLTINGCTNTSTTVSDMDAKEWLIL